MLMFTHSNITRSKLWTCIGTLCVVTCLLTAGASSHCQQPSNAPATQGGAPMAMSFDEVLLFPRTGADTGGGFLWWATPDYWQFANVSSLNLIANAYGLGMHQVIGFPGWAETDRYVLQTKLDREKLDAFKALPLDEELRQQRLMTQAVLVNRYQLKAHYETREMPVYELVVANGGAKLKEKVFEYYHLGSSFFRPRDWVNYGTMEDLASKLAGPTGSVVIDKTGLGMKTFFYELKWTSDRQSGVDEGTSIFTALEEQLGLKLVPATETAEVLVIDHIEKPAPEFQRAASAGPAL